MQLAPPSPQIKAYAIGHLEDCLTVLEAIPDQRLEGVISNIHWVIKLLGGTR